MIPIHEQHICELKVRLVEADFELLEAISKKSGIPKAVIARALIREHLKNFLNASISYVELIGSPE